MVELSHFGKFIIHTSYFLWYTTEFTFFTSQRVTATGTRVSNYALMAQLYTLRDVTQGRRSRGQGDICPQQILECPFWGDVPFYFQTSKVPTHDQVE